MNILPNELYWGILMNATVDDIAAIARTDKHTNEFLSSRSFWLQWLMRHEPRLVRFISQIDEQKQFINLIKASQGDRDAMETDSLREYMYMRKQQLVLNRLLKSYNKEFKIVVTEDRAKALGIPYTIDRWYMLHYVPIQHRFYLETIVNEQPSSYTVLDMDASAVMFLMVPESNKIKFYQRYLKNTHRP